MAELEDQINVIRQGGPIPVELVTNAPETTEEVGATTDAVEARWKAQIRAPASGVQGTPERSRRRPPRLRCLQPTPGHPNWRSKDLQANLKELKAATAEPVDLSVEETGAPEATAEIQETIDTAEEANATGSRYSSQEAPPDRVQPDDRADMIGAGQRSGEGR